MMDEKKLMEVKSEASLPRHWSKWIIDSLDDFETAERSVDEPFFEGCDEWTDKAIERMVLTTLPTIKCDLTKHSGAKLLGALIGHQEWLIENFDSFVPEEEDDAVIDEMNKNIAEFRKIMTTEHRVLYDLTMKARISSLNHLLISFEKICALKKSAISKIERRLINSASSSEKMEYMEAYAKAKNTPAIKPYEFLSTREKMLSLISLTWRDVQQMKNRSVVRDMLGTITGDPKGFNHEFVQGVCKDIGLNLSKRGRPKK